MTTTPFTSADFAKKINVSRETLERLEFYIEILKRWQKAINLVAPKSLEDPWRRHILDSAQLINYLPEHARSIVDLGSGAGLPGIVLAIMGQTKVHLVESDQRKAQFLKEVTRRLALDVTIHVKRIEALGSFMPDVVTARALAPLPRLLDLAAPLLDRSTLCLFLKGRQGKHELTEAAKSWMMTSEVLSEPVRSFSFGP